jgi:hypothetical protein
LDHIKNALYIGGRKNFYFLRRNKHVLGILPALVFACSGFCPFWFLSTLLYVRFGLCPLWYLSVFRFLINFLEKRNAPSGRAFKLRKMVVLEYQKVIVLSNL